MASVAGPGGVLGVGGEDYEDVALAVTDGPCGVQKRAKQVRRWVWWFFAGGNGAGGRTRV